MTPVPPRSMVYCKYPMAIRIAVWSTYPSFFEVGQGEHKAAWTSLCQSIASQENVRRGENNAQAHNGIWKQ